MFGNFMNSSNQVIGLDIGSHAIRMIQFRAVGGESLAVQAGAAYELPSPMPTDAEKRRGVILEGIAKLRSICPFVGKRVVSVLPCSDVQYKNIRIPKMPPDERAEAARWDAIDRMNLNAETARVSFLEAGEVRQGEEVRDELIVMAATADAVEQHMALLIEAGLQPEAIETTPAALGRAAARKIRRESDQSLVRCIVDVGKTTTKVLITRGTNVAFFKTIDVGGNQLDEAVARQLELSLADASDIRRKLAAPDSREGSDDQALFGSTRRENVRRAVLDASRPILSELAKEVGLCLRYYSVTFRGARPETIELAGGEANDPLIATVMSEELNAPAEPLKPLDGIDLSDPSLGIERRGAQSDWAIVAGLALRQPASIAARLRGAA